MALAKFKEDINEAYLEGADERINAHLARDPAAEWRKKMRVESELAALRNEHGLLWDDRESFITAKNIVASIDTTRPDLPVEVRWQGPSQALKITVSGDKIEIRAKHPISGNVLVECGHFRKSYRVSFVVGQNLEQLPDFSSRLAELTREPMRWTQKDFDEFRVHMDSLQTDQGLPKDFCDGVREYYLGLYHEQLRERRFGERLDTAYRMLRPFIKFSALAEMICGYHLFRINAFEQARAHRALSNIRQAANFFLESNEPKSGRLRSGPGRALEIVTSSADYHAIAAIVAIQRGKLDLASTEADRASEGLSEFDQEGRERLSFLRWKIASLSGEVNLAKRFAASLSSSATNSFRAAAGT